MAGPRGMEGRRGRPSSLDPGSMQASNSIGRRLPVEREGSLARRNSRAQRFADSSPTAASRGTPVKFMFLGDSETGKTAIVNRYITGLFDNGYKATVDVDFSQTNVMVGEQRLRLALWQVSDKKEGNVATNTFRGLHGVFIVADIARPETFHAVAKYRQTIDEKWAEVGPPGVNLPVVLLANKSDLLSEDGVSLNKGSMEKLCKRHRLHGWYATSAKDNSNVELAIKEVLRQAIKAGGTRNDLEVPAADLEALNVEMQQLNAPGAERERSPGQQVLRDHQWFGTQKVAKSQGCACVVS